MDKSTTSKNKDKFTKADESPAYEYPVIYSNMYRYDRLIKPGELTSEFWWEGAD